nr:selenide, water dikinase SelD [Acidimicrobiia bacterium]
ALEGRASIDCPDALSALAFDPQTSGGLLAAVAPAAVADSVEAGFSVVGAVEAGEPSVALVN